MFEYTIQAYDKTDLGKVNAIQITVEARTKEAAIEHAKGIEARTDYAVIAVKDLGGEFKKAPTKLPEPNKTRTIRKG